MKKVLLSLGLLVFSVSFASAQPEIRIAPEAGVTVGTMTQKTNHINRNHKYQAGVKAGGVVDLQWGQHFVLQPGAFILFNQGAETNYKRLYNTGSQIPAELSDRRRYHTTYVQVPVSLMYRGGTDLEGHWFVGAGPYLGFAVGGRFQQDYRNVLNGHPIVKRFDRSMDLGYKETDDLGRWDFGLQINAGYELPMGIFFRASYGYGLVNTSALQQWGDESHPYGGSVTVGYTFHLN